MCRLFQTRSFLYLSSVTSVKSEIDITYNKKYRIQLYKRVLFYLFNQDRLNLFELTLKGSESIVIVAL